MIKSRIKFRQNGINNQLCKLYQPKIISIRYRCVKSDSNILNKPKNESSKVNDKVGKIFNKMSESKRKIRKKKKKRSNSNEKLNLIENKEYITTENIFNKSIKQAIAPNQKDIPQLAHNLDRVLFSPGIHFLQDPRTRVYNFSPFLKKIIKHDEFNFDAISSFLPASKDTELLKNSQRFNKQFYSSTSSMTGILIKFYLFLNNYNKLDIDRFGHIPFNGLSYTSPNSLIVEPKGKLKQKNNNKFIYSIQADKSCDTETILSKMGHCMEILLTNPKDEFIKYSKNNESTEDIKTIPNTYNYSTYGDFLMRSQLDCYDSRLPGNGTFDLKTRASLNIRYNSTNPNINLNNYQIFKLKGEFESFEAEFKDLIRTGALLKYLFQGRIGQMDGIYIAYHNLNTLFGFQYLPLNEIDEIFYKSTQNSIYNDSILYKNDYNLIKSIEQSPSFTGETQFKWSIEIWENLLKKHILIDLEKNGFGNSPFRLITYTTKSTTNKKDVDLRCWVLPINTNEVEELQNFPNEFPASFNHQHLSTEIKLKNIMNHEKKLNEFNEKTTKDRPLLSYNITKLFTKLNQKQLKTISQLPLGKSNWQFKYKISKIENVDIDEYKQLFQRSIQSLYKQIEQDDKDIKNNVLKYKKKDARVDKIKRDIKSLEHLGYSRSKDWKKKDDLNIVYKQSEKV